MVFSTWTYDILAPEYTPLRTSPAYKILYWFPVYLPIGTVFQYLIIKTRYMAEMKVMLKNCTNFKIHWKTVSKLICHLGAQNHSKLSGRMEAADWPFLYAGYLSHQASPRYKLGMSEHAPVVLFMPIYFVLGQHDVQSPSRHDSVISTD